MVKLDAFEQINHNPNGFDVGGGKVKSSYLPHTQNRALNVFRIDAYGRRMGAFHDTPTAHYEKAHWYKVVRSLCRRAAALGLCVEPALAGRETESRKALLIEIAHIANCRGRDKFLDVLNICAILSQSTK